MGSGASSSKGAARAALPEDCDNVLLLDTNFSCDAKDEPGTAALPPRRRQTIAGIQREKGMALLKDVKESSKDMTRLAAVLKSPPMNADSKALKPDLFRKNGAKPPVAHAGYLETPSSTGAWKHVYYELIGGYLVSYKNEAAAAGKPKAISLFTYVLDSANVVAGGALKDLDPEFVGESEAIAPVSIMLYTRSKARARRARGLAQARSPRQARRCP
jgi:hypothetical protein